MSKGMRMLLAGAWLAAGAAWPTGARAEEEDLPPPPHEDPAGESEEARGLLETLKKRDPEAHRLFLKARERHPRSFHRRMRELRPMLKHPELRAVMVRNVAAEMRVRELAEKARAAEDPKQKEGLRKELRQALAEQFDARMAAHEQRVERMQKDIERVRQKIAKRKGLRDKLIDKRLSELMSDEEAWDW